jgi:hypothetical protein
MDINDLKTRYQNKTTDELLEIWQKNDQTTYREEAFEAIKQILLERKCDLPPQYQHIDEIDDGKCQNVVLTDIEMPFWSMVFFMVKWAVAAIPAMFILGFFGGIAWMLVGGVIEAFS